jgi:hypothetical protein
MRIIACLAGRPSAGRRHSPPIWLWLALSAASLTCFPSDLWFLRMQVAHVDLAHAAMRHGLPQHVYRRQDDGYGVFATRVGGYWCALVEVQDV